MPVVQANIKADLLSLYSDAESGEGISAEEFADRLATIIQDAIRSGEVQTGILDTGGDTTTTKGVIL